MEKTEPGFSAICTIAVEAASVMDRMRKTWRTWKQKYAFWVNNSASVLVLAPATPDKARMITGTNDMRIERATAGNKPEMTPRIF